MLSTTLYYSLFKFKIIKKLGVQYKLIVAIIYI